MLEKYDDILSVQELAKALKIGRNNAYELVRSGKIKSVAIGRQIRVTKAAVIEFLSGEKF
jgi:excisionase family DNA binding protein